MGTIRDSYMAHNTGSHCFQYVFNLSSLLNAGGLQCIILVESFKASGSFCFQLLAEGSKETTNRTVMTYLKN